ncbi:hypothetical protein ROZALSC1DRAFT_7479, partial [Rozella allomycis CSF55]
MYLPFRKTNQLNDQMQSFPLARAAKENIHLCPVTWFNIWTYKFGQREGPLFVNINDDDQPIPSCPMTRSFFMRHFKQHLQAIGLDPAFFGTHSFRRGGVHFFN